jgi:putative ABC transport system substrate-binding protein
MQFGQLKRREVITLLGGATVAWPLATRAQQSAGRTVRIGVLRASLEDPFTGPAYPDFLEELRKSGFSEGQNLEIGTVTVQQDAQRLFAETANLVRSKVELLVATGPEIVLKAAMAASQTIPIVMWAINFDPIARGYVKSLAQPGGNITGIVSLQTELAAKQVELLTEAFPERMRLAILYDENSADQLAAAERAARSLHLNVRSLKLENPPYDFDVAFQSLAEGSPQMLLVLFSQFFSPYRARIAELAIQQRLPAMLIFKGYAEAGGLMSYGPGYPTLFRRLGFYAAKILNTGRGCWLQVFRSWV